MVKLDSIYYNYDTITISGLTNNSASGAISISSPNQNTCLQINYGSTQINYFAKSMYFYKENDIYYLIIENTSDPNNSSMSNVLYLAIPLTLGNSTTVTDIDNVYNANTSIVSFTLNDHIISGEKAYDSDVIGGSRTITLETPMLINTQTLNKLAAEPNNLHIGTKDSGYTECNPIKQVLDWNVTCTLVGEDSSSGTTQYSASNPDNMDGMVIIIVLLMIVSGIYMMMPVIYLQFIVGIARTRTSAPLNSIDKFWTFICFLALIAFLIVGVATKKNTYYFLFVCIFLLFFSSKKWISDNVGNITAKDAATAGPQMVTTLDGKDLDPGMFSILNSENATFKYIQIGLFIIILSMFSTAIALGVAKNGHASDDFTASFCWVFASAIALTGFSGNYESYLPPKGWQLWVAIGLFIIIGVIPMSVALTNIDNK